MKKLILLSLLFLSCKPSNDGTLETFTLKVNKTWSTAEVSGDFLSTSTWHTYCMNGFDGDGAFRIVCSDNDDNKHIMGLDGIIVKVAVKVKKVNRRTIETYNKINISVLSRKK